MVCKFNSIPYFDRNNSTKNRENKRKIKKKREKINKIQLQQITNLHNWYKNDITRYKLFEIAYNIWYN
jgi:hypothetical protein